MFAKRGVLGVSHNLHYIHLLRHLPNRFSLLHLLFLHHWSPHLKVLEDSIGCQGTEDPNKQTVEQRKVLNESWSLGDAG